MLTNIHLLFILLLINTFSFSQEDEETCNTITPTSRNDCFSISVSNGYCCYKTTGENCTIIQKKDLSNSKEYDCGITGENYGKYEFGQYHPKQEVESLGFVTCGKISPSKKKDCTDYSEISNSCCLFTIDGKKTCLHIGRKYIGDLKEKSFNFEGKDVKYECKSFNIIFNLYLILLIALFL